MPFILIFHFSFQCLCCGLGFLAILGSIIRLIFPKELEYRRTCGSHVAFVIGGSLGLDKRVLDRADMKLSFSKMTFPHQLMRVILLEQVYRAYRIMTGAPYHK